MAVNKNKPSKEDEELNKRIAGLKAPTGTDYELYERTKKVLEGKGVLAEENPFAEYSTAPIQESPEQQAAALAKATKQVTAGLRLGDLTITFNEDISKFQDYTVKLNQELKALEESNKKLPSKLTQARITICKAQINLNNAHIQAREKIIKNFSLEKHGTDTRVRTALITEVLPKFQALEQAKKSLENLEAKNIRELQHVTAPKIIAKKEIPSKIENNSSASNNSASTPVPPVSNVTQPNENISATESKQPIIEIKKDDKVYFSADNVAEAIGKVIGAGLNLGMMGINLAIKAMDFVVKDLLPAVGKVFDKRPENKLHSAAAQGISMKDVTSFNNNEEVKQEHHTSPKSSR